ncbi:hypothetical protein F5Y16DRAFT_404533 [Xylariaceae sp. FL0255]|nr:hypothetical protein F5Y16DRAFT_404533 [Xylariaceae sp. FL0255]
MPEFGQPILFFVILYISNPDEIMHNFSFQAVTEMYIEDCGSIENFLAGKYSELDPDRREGFFPPMHYAAACGKTDYLTILVEKMPKGYDFRGLLCHFYDGWGDLFRRWQTCFHTLSKEQRRILSPFLGHRNCQSHRDLLGTESTRRREDRCVDAFDMALRFCRDEAASYLLSKDLVQMDKQRLGDSLNLACWRQLPETFKGLFDKYKPEQELLKRTFDDYLLKPYVDEKFENSGGIERSFNSEWKRYPNSNLFKSMQGILKRKRLSEGESLETRDYYLSEEEGNYFEELLKRPGPVLDMREHAEEWKVLVLIDFFLDQGVAPSTAKLKDIEGFLSKLSQDANMEVAERIRANLAL